MAISRRTSGSSFALVTQPACAWAGRPTSEGTVSRCLPRPPVVMHDVLNVSCPATVVVAELPVPLEAGMPGAAAFEGDVVRRIAPAQIEYPGHHGGRPYARPPTAS